MSFFKRRIDAGLGREAPNDCDLEAYQQQRIERDGRSNVQKNWGSRWTASNEDGDQEQVPPDVYMGDDDE